MRNWFRHGILGARPREIYLLLGLVALSFAVYANTFPGIIHLDDQEIVFDNPLVLHPNLKAIFTTDYWGAADHSGLFRPLTILSFALNRALLGSQPWGFHLVNVLLHAAAACLLYRVLARWNFTVGTAWLAAALFAVHPFHTEVVNGAVGRSELLVALFGLGALYVARKPTWMASAGALLLFTLALLSKEHAVTLLLLLPAVDWFLAGDTPFLCRRRLVLYGGMLTVAVFWLGWRTLGVEYGPVVHLPHPSYLPLAFLPASARVLTALKLQGLYLAKLLVPVGLQGVYAGVDFPGIVESPWSSAGLMVTVASLLATGVAVAGWRRRSALALFAVLYGVSFALTANVIFPIGVTMAERLAYFPSLWFCAAVAEGVVQAGRKCHREAWGAWAGLAVVCLFGVMLVVRNQDFSSPISVWQADVRVQPGNFMAWMYLGHSLADAGRLAEAEQAYREVLRLKPDFPHGLRSYAGFLLEQGRPAEAVAVALRAATGSHNQIPMVYLILAKGYADLAQYPEALSWSDQAAPYFGNDPLFWEVRGLALEGLGRTADAVDIYRQLSALQLETDAPRRLGMLLLNTQRYAEAEAILRLVAEKENDPALWNSLGVALAMQGNGRGAEAAFARAVALAPGSVKYLDNLQRARRQSN